MAVDRNVKAHNPVLVSKININLDMYFCAQLDPASIKNKWLCFLHGVKHQAESVIQLKQRRVERSKWAPAAARAAMMQHTFT